MDNEEIEKIFSKENRFIGVFAIDEISEITLKKEQGLVVNTSERNIQYGHWVAIYKSKNDEVYFLDSLSIKNLINLPQFLKFFIDNNIKYVKILCHGIQPPTSQTCGAYVVYFLSHLFNGFSFLTIISKFDTRNLELNDITVLTYVCNMIQ
jgi:hypothetical protein